MVEIVLNPEQSHLLETSVGYVAVRDAAGHVVGYLTGQHFSPARIKEAEARLDSEGPWHTTEQVFTHLRSFASP